MEAYLPGSTDHTLALLVGTALTLLCGFGLTRRLPLWPARIGAWSVVVAGFVTMHILLIDAPAGFRMLAIIGVVLYAMKAVVYIEDRASGAPALGASAFLSWAALWPGMDPALFSTLGSGARPEAPQDGLDRRSARDFFLRGSLRLAMGVALLFMARYSWIATDSLILATVLALPGLSLVLHFGLFNLLCGFWRALGINTYTLFPAPLYSTSLSEFWGRRWNLPFTEMIKRAVYRPTSKTLGRNAAAVLGFAASGVLHECAISVPVNAAYGLPMLYFVIHGALVFAERTTPLGQFLKAHTTLARVWTLGWLALPMPVLFHPPFLKGVVWPILGIV